jgi:hypothetical protein
MWYLLFYLFSSMHRPNWAVSIWYSGLPSVFWQGMPLLYDYSSYPFLEPGPGLSVALWLHRSYQNTKKMYLKDK